MSAMNAVDHRTDELKTTQCSSIFQTLSSADLVKTLEAKHINIDEMHHADVHAIIAAQKETVVKGTAAEDGKVPETFARTKLYLQQHILNFMHSETEMMRYMTSLQHKDLFLTITMISLGSCAMKLNSVESLTTSSWQEVMKHSFPRSHKQHLRLQGDDVELPG